MLLDCRFVKLWSLSELSEADSGEDSQNFFLQPLQQLQVGAGVRVRGLLWQAPDRCLVSDQAGSLIQASTLNHVAFFLLTLNSHPRLNSIHLAWCDCSLC